MNKWLLLIVGILLSSVIVFGKDKPCNNKCTSVIYDICNSGKYKNEGYSKDPKDLVKLYGESIITFVSNHTDEARMYCEIAAYYNKISVEKYAQKVVPSIRWYIANNEIGPLEMYVSSLIDHLDNPNDETTEGIIAYSIDYYAEHMP